MGDKLIQRVQAERLRKKERQERLQEVLLHMPALNVEAFLKGFRSLLRLRELTKTAEFDGIIGVLEDFIPAYSYDLTHDLNEDRGESDCLYGDANDRMIKLDKLALDSNVSLDEYYGIMLRGEDGEKLSERDIMNTLQLSFNETPDVRYKVVGSFPSEDGLIVALANGQEFLIKSQNRS